MRNNIFSFSNAQTTDSYSSFDDFKNYGGTQRFDPQKFDNTLRQSASLTLTVRFHPMTFFYIEGRYTFAKVDESFELKRKVMAASYYDFANLQSRALPATNIDYTHPRSNECS